MIVRMPTRFARSLCTVGLLLGTLFFAASLTPSLLPRTQVMQGMLSGFAFSAGYGIGVFGRWLWHYLELPPVKKRHSRIIHSVAGFACAAIAVVFLWRATEWQNSIRVLMELDPVEGTQPFQVGLLALGVFLILLTIARVFSWTSFFLSRRFKRIIPQRISHVLGFGIAIALFWSVANGLVFSVGLRVADSSFQQLDALIESDVDRPADPWMTGSAESLISWEDLGRRGRTFVSRTPTTEAIGAFKGDDAMTPLRVYVGLNAADTPEERARLALEELHRVDAFDREALIIVTPTGTGWIDPPAISSVEYLLGGNVASVAVQYSYLASWLALLTEPSYGIETARALFNEVYGYWRSLPQNDRPKLYLHGLSLGALNSDRAADMFDIIADPFHGALWSGPPFPSETWATATRQRQPWSPAWLPRFRDGSVIRFANQTNPPVIPGGNWGPVRIVFLQYASDPVTFFRTDILYRRPDWLSTPRGFDVSDQLRWFPVVTFLQLIIDIPAANTAPSGYGHVYAARDYIDAWYEIIEPPGWTEGEIERLKFTLVPPW